jgi:hypothetical protein
MVDDVRFIAWDCLWTSTLYSFGFLVEFTYIYMM